MLEQTLEEVDEGEGRSLRFPTESREMTTGRSENPPKMSCLPHPSSQGTSAEWMAED